MIGSDVAVAVIVDPTTIIPYIMSKNSSRSRIYIRRPACPLYNNNIDVIRMRIAIMCVCGYVSNALRTS